MNTYLETGDKKSCTGCLACVYSCPSKALSVSSGFDGFLYPEMDAQKCVHCGLCQKVCPNDSSDKVKSAINNTYGVVHKDEEVLLKSSSGGAFTAISDALMDTGYVVYGATMDKDYRVVHACAESKAQRDAMRISKYVQSNMEGIFPQIKARLDDGENVLFTGTPCQVSGLRLFLKKEYENLFTVDLVCNGVASPKLHEDLVRFVGGNQPITCYAFRSKENCNWHTSQHIVCKGESVNTKCMNAFYTFYGIRMLGFRKSCRDCKYTDTARAGDLSIGDFWPITGIDKDFFDERGVSLVCVNTEKGAALMKKIAESGACAVKETDLQATLRSVNRLHKPMVPNVLDDKFWKYYETHSFEKTYKIFGDYTLYSRLRRKPLEYLYKYLLHR